MVLLKQSPAAHRVHLPAGRRASTYTARSARNGLRANCPDYIPENQWFPNSLILNPMDYFMWGQCRRLTASLRQSRKQSLKSRKRFRLSGANCHKNRSRRLWKTYQTKRLKACVGAKSWQ